MGEEALFVDAPRPRLGEPAQLADGVCAALLSEADQSNEHLCRRLGVRKRPVTRLDRGAEEVRQGAEADAGDAAAEQAPREPDRVDDRRGEAAPREALHLAVEERQVEARVVRHEHGVAREREEPAHRPLCRRSASEIGLPDPCQGGDRSRERRPRVDERLEDPGRLQASQPDGADLADRCGSRAKASRLEVDHGERGRLERRLLAAGGGQGDAGSPPGQAGIPGDHVGEQRPRKPVGGVPEREERSRRLGSRDGAAALLDQLDEPIGGVESELHSGSIGEHMFARKRPKTRRGPQRGPRS